MSENLAHQPCPHPTCGSSDAFSYNFNGYGKCHSCGNSYPKKGVAYADWVYEAYPLENKLSGYMKDTTDLIETPKQTLTWVYQAARGIHQSTMQLYGVQTGLDEDGEPVAQSYVYPSGGKKTRWLPKQFSAENLKSDELFGMNRFNAGSSRYVVITEGELDAMSAYQMLNTDPKYVTPVVSLPSATPSNNLWKNTAITDWLGSFEKIYVSFDSDGKSDHIATKLMNLYPNRVYQIPHDKYKDANEFLMDKAGQAYKAAWFNAKKFTPETVACTPDQFIELYREAQESSYVPTGIHAFDDKALGLMQGHFTVIKAQTGLGKSELMRYLEYNLLENHPEIKFAIWHLEESRLRSILGLVSYKLGVNVTRKDLVAEKGLTDEDVEKAIRVLTENENLHQFFLKDEDDHSKLLDHIRYLVEACGCQYVFFEPIQDVVANLGTDGDKEAALADLSVRLSKLAAELNVGIITIAHTNDDGQIKYCRMIGQRASVVVELDRDRESKDETIRNTTKLFIRKNRPASLEGPAGQLLFDPMSFTLTEKTYNV